jgi:hypothetical protein
MDNQKLSIEEEYRSRIGKFIKNCALRTTGDLKDFNLAVWIEQSGRKLAVSQNLIALKLDLMPRSQRIGVVFEAVTSEAIVLILQ